MALDENRKKDNLIKKLKKDWNLRDYVVMVPCDSEAESLRIELLIIKEIGIKNLTNLTSGGIGMSGFKHSDEFRKLISKANKRPKPPGFSEKLSKAKKGIPLTEAHKKALSGRKFTDAHREKLSKAKLKTHDNANSSRKAGDGDR